MPEQFDLVNEKDEVVGTTNKIESHNLGYPHRVAAVFIFDGADRLLVQLRKKDGLLDHSVGGHVRQGETYDQAAARELGEEVGLAVPLDKVGMFYADERVPARNHNVVHWFGVYEIKLDNAELGKMILSQDEIIELKPISIEDIAKQMIDDPSKWTLGFMSTLNFYAKQ